MLCEQELKKKQFEQQRKQAAKDIRLSAYTAEADLKVGIASQSAFRHLPEADIRITVRHMSFSMS